MLRRLLEASHKIQSSVRERSGEPRDLVEQAERMMFEVAHDTASQDFASITDILERETTRLEELSEGKRDLTGTPSGFADLDRITGGFQPGNLIIVAARPSMGKSAIVANIADFVAVEKKLPVAFFSLEMSETELAHRFLACRAGISGDKLRKGQVKNDWSRILKASNQLARRRRSGSTRRRTSRSSSCARRHGACTRRRADSASSSSTTCSSCGQTTRGSAGSSRSVPSHAV